MSGTTSDLDVEMLHRERRRASSAAHRERRKRASQVVAGISGLSAVGAAISGGNPTEIVALDVLYLAAYAVVVTVAATRAKRWTWFVVAGAAGGIGLGAVTAALCSILALAAAYWSMKYGRRQREIGAFVGAMAAQALLRLPTDMAFAVPTIVAALAPAPMIVSALRNTKRPGRYLWPVMGAVATLAAIGALFVVAMLGIESDARDGVSAARDGLSSAKAGDDAAATAAFAEAAGALDRAGDAAGAWWLLPARAVPVLSQHLAAVDDVTEEGSTLAALSLDQIAVLDIDGLGAADGGFDLARVAALAPVAERVATALETASATVSAVDSPWLVPAVAERVDEFLGEVDDVAPAARNAADGLRVAPALLGADGTRSYVVLVGNPAEARELGGFVAAIGVLTASDGQLEFRSDQRISQVNRSIDEAGITLDDVDLPTPLRESRPREFAQNWSNSVDFDAVATVARTFGPAVAGAPVDGVLYVDPYSLAALVSVTGPIPVEGLDRPLAADEVADFMLREQYLVDNFESDGERKELLADAAEAAFDRLLNDGLPDPRVLANALAPLVQGRRLLFSTTDPEAAPLLDRIGLSPAVDTNSPDQIQLAVENLRANKLNAYLTRELTYDVEVDDDGNATARLTVDLINGAPLDGLPDYVVGDGDLNVVDATVADTTDRIGLDLHSAFGVDRVTVDGTPVPNGDRLIGRLTRSNIQVEIPAQTTVRVVFELSGAVAGDYALAVLPNATAMTDTFAGSITRGGRVPQSLPSVPIDRVLRFG